jgi:hypothetical protein
MRRIISQKAKMYGYQQNPVRRIHLPVGCWQIQLHRLFIDTKGRIVVVACQQEASKLNFKFLQWVQFFPKNTPPRIDF